MDQYDKPTPEQVNLSPSSSEGGIKPKRPSDRTRDYLLAQKAKKADQKKKKKSPCKTKKPLLKRSKQFQRLKTLKYEATKEEHDTDKNDGRKKDKKVSKSPPADPAGGAEPARPSALAVAPKAKAKAKAVSQDTSGAGGEDAGDLQRFSHKMYMRYWRSVNQCHFVRTKYLRDIRYQHFSSRYPKSMCLNFRATCTYVCKYLYKRNI